MGNNVIETENGEALIFSGGNPLKDCPTDWDQANNLIEKMNEDKSSGEPLWSFDCGFKLDFDGAVVKISSRFYPPKSHWGETWDGTVSVYFLSETVEEKKFDCESIDELKQQVEEYVKTIIEKVKSVFNQSIIES